MTTADRNSLFPGGSSIAFYASDFGERESLLLQTIEEARGVPGFFASAPDLYAPALEALGEGASEESKNLAFKSISAFRASLAVRLFTRTIPSKTGKTRRLVQTETACRLYELALRTILGTPSLLREVMALKSVSAPEMLSDNAEIRGKEVEDKVVVNAVSSIERARAEASCYGIAPHTTLLPVDVKKDEAFRLMERLATDGTQGLSPDLFDADGDGWEITFNPGEPLPGTATRAGRPVLRVILSLWRAAQKGAPKGMTVPVIVTPSQIVSLLAGKKITETKKNQALFEDIISDVRAYNSVDCAGSYVYGFGKSKQECSFDGKVLFAEIVSVKSASGKIVKEAIAVKAVNSVLASPVRGRQAITIQYTERRAVLGSLRINTNSIALADTFLNVLKSKNLRFPQIDLRTSFFSPDEEYTRQNMRSALDMLHAICENAKAAHMIADYSDKKDGREKIGVILERLPETEKVVTHKTK